MSDNEQLNQDIVESPSGKGDGGNVNAAADVIVAASAVANAHDKMGIQLDNKLKDGRTFEIKPAFGSDVIKALRLVGTDTENLMPAMLHQSVLFEGVQIPMEEILELPAGDFLKVMGKFSEINF